MGGLAARFAAFDDQNSCTFFSQGERERETDDSAADDDYVPKLHFRIVKEEFPSAIETKRRYFRYVRRMVLVTSLRTFDFYNFGRVINLCRPMPSSNKIAKAESASPWIYGPWLDLMVGCGAWSAPLLLLSYFAMGSSARTWAVAFYGLAFVFNYPHYMATIYRAYHRAEDFRKYRVFTVHITALIVLTMLLSHVWPRILPWIFTIYLTWSPWHYSGQNYGLFMMFARRAGAQPEKAERRALYGAFVVSYLVLFLGFHTGPSTDPLFLSLGIPAVVSRWEQALLLAAFLVLSAFGLSRLARTTGWRKLGPSLTLFSTQFLWFLLPAGISLIRGIEIPQSRYSTGVLAIMHSAQYLWITSYYARREASDEGGRSWRPVAYFGALIAGGIALFVPGPWVASRIFHRDFTASFLIFTALVNIHHFILDGAIWKLRDGRIAALLLNSRERISGAAASAGGGMATAWRWLAGSTSGARALRVGVALMLLAWGSVDQLRFYLAMRSDDLTDLERAARLDSMDSRLQARLAQRELAEGQPELAEAAWKKAIQVNPSDPAPRQALLRFLVDRKRFDEAFDLTEASLKYSPRDANLLVDRGLLASHKGHPELAVASWDRALTIDPGQSLPHLYLADELDREGKPKPAAEHYNAFLQQISRQSRQQRPAADKIIAIVIRMADCQSRAAENAQAIASYRLAESLAVQTNQAKLESVADVNEAALQTRQGNLPEAMRLYQHALQLDDKTNDRNASAEDWLTYGHFLSDQGFPARLAYACFKNAENLAGSDAGVASRQAAKAAKDIENKKAGDIGAVRRDPEPALREALALRP
jgi:tetratricopeptide (TPR) repeat protein